MTFTCFFISMGNYADGGGVGRSRGNYSQAVRVLNRTVIQKHVLDFNPFSSKSLSSSLGGR